MSQAWIGLGSNLGRREQYLRNAAKSLGKLGNVRFASVYETEPVFPPGICPSGRPFLNTVCRLETTYNVLELFAALRRIEQQNERTSLERFAPRTLDADLLAFDRLCVRVGKPEKSYLGTHQSRREFNLCLPHPRMHLRKFVLVPLCELDPLWNHPSLGRSAAELLSLTTDHSAVNLHCAASDLFL